MFHPVKSASVTDFKGSRLVVVSLCISLRRMRGFIVALATQPCVSVGNVAQLASDLLISTLKMERVGHLHDQCLLPLICQSAFDHNSGALSTSAEGILYTRVCIT